MTTEARPLAISPRPADDTSGLPALTGVRVLELAGKGPVPFGCMMLADLGADVIRIDRVTAVGAPPDINQRGVGRGRRSIALDLKQDAARDAFLELVATSDVLVEGFRPGVTERLGIGPEPCLERNPRLVYSRMTGWGQVGPLAQAPGHDINFLALSGALFAIGDRAMPPPPPLTLIADYGGGAAHMVIGVLAALTERARTGRGQVIETAMLDAVVNLLVPYYTMRAAGAWSDQRQNNMVDGAAPWYRTYATSDGGFIAVGCIEPAFYQAFLARLELDPANWPQHDRSQWAHQRERLAEIFASRSRDEWEAHFDGSEACVTPVLAFSEVPSHPHIAARGLITGDGRRVRPHPLLPSGRGADGPPAPEVAAGEHTVEILQQIGLSAERVERMLTSRAVVQDPDTHPA